MFSKIMVLAATASFIALAAPHDAALAQTRLGDDALGTQAESDRCFREALADSAFSASSGLQKQAEIQARQAAELRALQKNALDNANAAGNTTADTTFWNDEARRRGEDARRLEDSAMRYLECSKAEHAKFLELEPRADVREIFGGDAILAKELRELLADQKTEDGDEAEDEAEPTPQKEKKSQEKKKQTKTEKPKKPANIKKPANKTNKVAGRVARDVAVIVASGLILDGMIGNHGKRNKICRRNCDDRMNENSMAPRKGKKKLWRLSKPGIELF